MRTNQNLDLEQGIDVGLLKIKMRAVAHQTQ